MPSAFPHGRTAAALLYAKSLSCGGKMEARSGSTSTLYAASIAAACSPTRARSSLARQMEMLFGIIEGNWFS